MGGKIKMFLWCLFCILDKVGVLGVSVGEKVEWFLFEANIHLCLNNIINVI